MGSKVRSIAWPSALLIVTSFLGAVVLFVGAFILKIEHAGGTNIALALSGACAWLFVRQVVCSDVASPWSDRSR